ENLGRNRQVVMHDVALAVDVESKADHGTYLEIRRPELSHHFRQLFTHLGAEATKDVLPRLARRPVRKVVGQCAAFPQGTSRVVPGKGEVIIAVNLELVEDGDWAALAGARGGDVQDGAEWRARREHARIARVGQVARRLALSLNGGVDYHRRKRRVLRNGVRRVEMLEGFNGRRRLELMNGDDLGPGKRSDGGDRD